MIDQVTASTSASGVSAVLAKQQGKGRFATHADLFASFQQLVMDMQAKVLDPQKVHLAETHKVARMERASDGDGTDWRTDITARDTGRNPTDDRPRRSDRTRGASDDHNVSQRDDAGRDYADSRRSDNAAAAGDNRNDGARAGNGGDNGRDQNVTGRDGAGDRNSNNASKDGQSGVKDAGAGNQGNGQQAGAQNQGQAQNGVASAVQASIGATQANAILTTLVAQAANTETGQQVAAVAKGTGDVVVDGAQQQSGESLRGNTHLLGQGVTPAKQIRNIANLQTNGQAKGEGAKQAESLLKAQAGEIAKAAGAENKLIVNVNVTDDAFQTGKPLAALTAAAAAAAGQQQAAQSGQQVQAQQQAQVQNPVAQAAIAQSHQNPAQAQATQAQAQNGPAAQAQTASQITADAKGPVQATSGTSNAGTHGANSNADGNASQTNSNTGQTQNSQQAQHAHKTAPQQQPHQAARNKVVDQVTVQINKAIKAGADKINIRLYPAELGKVEVRLEVAHDGRTIATVTADRPETLDMLRRDSDQLSKALQDAGLDMEAGDLNYNLKGQEDGKEQKTADHGFRSEAVTAEEEALAPIMDQAMAAHELGILHNGRIDVRA